MTRDLFGEQAHLWDDNPQRVRMARTVAQAMAQALKLGPADRVLDYGAGTGLVSLALAGLVEKVIAVDSSPGMLGVLREKIAAAGLDNVSATLWSAGQDPAALPQVNVVTGSMVLHHVEDVAQALRALADLLPRGGRAAFADLDLEDGSFHGRAMHAFHNGFDRKTLCDLAASAGFTDVSTRDLTTLTKPGPDGTPATFGVFLLTARKD